jgi:hypothetical protein
VFALDLALPLKGSIHGGSDFFCEIAVCIADFTLATFLFVLADATTLALFADVSSYAMLAYTGAFAFFAVESSFAMFADAGAIAFFAVVSLYAMLAYTGAFAFFAVGSSCAMLAEAGAFAFWALVSSFAMLAKCLGVANGAMPLQLVVWAFLMDLPHFSDNQPNLRQVLPVLDFFSHILYHFIT